MTHGRGLCAARAFKPPPLLLGFLLLLRLAPLLHHPAAALDPRLCVVLRRVVVCEGLGLAQLLVDRTTLSGPDGGDRGRGDWGVRTENASAWVCRKGQAGKEAGGQGTHSATRAASCAASAVAAASACLRLWASFSCATARAKRARESPSPRATHSSCSDGCSDQPQQSGICAAVPKTWAAAVQESEVDSSTSMTNGPHYDYMYRAVQLEIKVRE